MGRFFQRLALFRAARGVPTWVLVALALGFWALAAFDAKAQTPHNDLTAEAASAHCNTFPNQAAGQALCEIWHFTATAAPHSCPESAYGGARRFDERYQCSRPGSTQTTLRTPNMHYGEGLACDAGWVRDTTTGECYDADEVCKALNSEPGFVGVGPTARSFVNSCRANGCNFGIRPGTPYTSTNSGTSSAVHHGQYEWTGACTPSADPPPEPEPEPQQECSVAGAMGDGTEIKQCVQKDGRVCITMPKSGKQACWTPGQTGEQASGPHLQKREGGDKVANPTPPANPDVTSQPPSIKTTTTNQPGGVVITTTTTNYVTNDGTDAGPDTGVPDDGATDGGEGDGDGNGVGGDGDCAGLGWAPSGDAILGAILSEAWKTRCRGDKQDADNESDASALGDASDSMEADPSEFFGETGLGVGIDEGWFSFNAAACPPLPSVTFPGTDQPFAPPPEFCEMIAALALLFQLIAYVWALRIVNS